MTSLRAVLPDDSSALWRSSWSNDAVSDPRFAVEMRVRHVAIRDTVVVIDSKGEHVEYKIEVMTQTFQWFVFHRYSEFVALHKELVKLFDLKRDMLPSKRMTGNLASSVIKDRQFALQRYLQRLINSHPELLFSKPLLDFLDVLKHDVIAVAGKLAKHFREHGDEVLRQHKPIHLTPNQCRCAAKRRHLPMDAHVPPEVATEPLSAYGHPSFLPDLFEICQRMTQLVVAPRKLKGARQPEVYTDDSSIDLSVFPSLTFLEIFYVPCTKIHHLNTVQRSLRHLKVSRCQVQSLRYILADAVTVRTGPIKPTATGVDSWRVLAVSRLSAHKRILRRWESLEHLNLSYNQIHTVDPSCLELVPLLEVLNLSCNNMVDINTWLYRGTPLARLRKLDMSFNDITTLVAPSPEELAAFPSRRLNSFNRRTPPGTPGIAKPIHVSAGWSRPSTTRGSPSASSLASPTKPSPAHSHAGSMSELMGAASSRSSLAVTPTKEAAALMEEREGEGDEEVSGEAVGAQKAHVGEVREQVNGSRHKVGGSDGGDDASGDINADGDGGGGGEHDEGGPAESSGSDAASESGDDGDAGGAMEADVSARPMNDDEESDDQGGEEDDDDEHDKHGRKGDHSGDGPSNRSSSDSDNNNSSSSSSKTGEEEQLIHAHDQGEGANDAVAQSAMGRKRADTATPTANDGSDGELTAVPSTATRDDGDDAGDFDDGGSPRPPPPPLVTARDGRASERDEGSATPTPTAANHRVDLEGAVHTDDRDGGVANVGAGADRAVGDAGTAASRVTEPDEGKMASPEASHLQRSPPSPSPSPSPSSPSPSPSPSPSSRHSAADASDSDDEFALLLEEEEKIEGTLDLSKAVAAREAWLREVEEENKRKRKEERRRRRNRGDGDDASDAVSLSSGPGAGGGERDGMSPRRRGSIRSWASQFIPSSSSSAAVEFTSREQGQSSHVRSGSGGAVGGGGGGGGDVVLRNGSSNGLASSSPCAQPKASLSPSPSATLVGTGSVTSAASSDRASPFERPLLSARDISASTTTLQSFSQDSVFQFGGAGEHGSRVGGDDDGDGHGDDDTSSIGGGGGGGGGGDLDSDRFVLGVRPTSISSDFSLHWPSSNPHRLCDLMPMLNELHLASNLLRSLDGLQNLRCLEYLDVRSNRLDALTSIEAIRTLPKLNQLLIQGNGLSRQHKRYRKTIWLFFGGAKFIIDGQEPAA